jgi:hypothetical protein
MAMDQLRNSERQPMLGRRDSISSDISVVDDRQPLLYHEEHGLNSFQVAVNLIKCTVGAGTFSLPYAFKVRGARPVYAMVCIVFQSNLRVLRLQEYLPARLVEFYWEPYQFIQSSFCAKLKNISANATVDITALHILKLQPLCFSRRKKGDRASTRQLCT